MTTPTLAVVVAALNALETRLWRWPGGLLGVWPPPPPALAVGVMAHKAALLDLADARARREGDPQGQAPGWARAPDAEGWYAPPGDVPDVRFLPDGGYQFRWKPEAIAALNTRGAAQVAEAEAWFASHTKAEWRARVEDSLSDDVEPREL